MRWLGIETVNNLEEADWLELSKDEHIIDKKNPHIVDFVIPILGGVMLVLMIAFLVLSVSGIPNVFAWMGVFPGGVLALFAVLKWKTTIYVITNAKIYKRWGVFSEDKQTVRIDKVQNTSSNLSWFDRVIGFGDIEVFTSGSGGQDMYITNIPDAKAWDKLINKLMDEVGETAEGESSSFWIPEEDPNNPAYQ